MEKNLPEKKFSSGSMIATVWNNQKSKDGQTFEYKTVSLQRRYTDKEGKWQTASTLRLNDLPKAALVLEEAYRYLALNAE